MSAAPAPVVLLGGQRFDPSVRAVADGLGLGEPIALVTAGWQEREEEDGELVEHLGRETVNLRLYERTEEIYRADRALRDAHRDRQELLRRRQTFYRIRLEHLLDAAQAIRTRSGAPEILALEEAASNAYLQDLDATHLRECVRVRAEFDQRCGTFERPAIVRHRAELQEVLSGVAAVAIAGGHVGALLARLHLLGFGSLIAGKPLLAWSAGAMVLTRRVVLYHDHPPQGPGASQVLDEGLGLVPGLVVLPEPEVRLAADRPGRVALMAARFAPDRCLGFPARSHVTLLDGRVADSEAVVRLDQGGELVAVTPEAAP